MLPAGGEPKRFTSSRGPHAHQRAAEGSRGRRCLREGVILSATLPLCLADPEAAKTCHVSVLQDNCLFAFNAQGQLYFLQI
jgi:hypothetical protein